MPVIINEWAHNLPLQQQSILMLACRGPDGVRKYHPCKEIVRRYRASVQKAAIVGRPTHVDERFADGNSYLNLECFSDDKHWRVIVGMFFQDIDEIPHHYLLHLYHGAEIIGYKHPANLFRDRWRSFYEAGCRDMHLPPETEEQMDARLCDWERVYWDEESR